MIAPASNPEGRVVVITPLSEGGFRVTLLPQPATGDVSRKFVTKGDAFDFARETWTKFRCGLVDYSDGQTGNHNKSEASLRSRSDRLL